MIKKLKKFFVNLMCLFIWNKTKRKAFRTKFIPQKINKLAELEEIRSKTIETILSIPIQDKYDLSTAKKAKKAVVFVEVEPYRMCGGQMNVFELCRCSKEILNDDTAVLMTTMPGKYTYAHNDHFTNDIDICRWEQIMDIIKDKKDVIIHIPEGDIVHCETHKETLKDRLSAEDIEILKTIQNLQINILIQRIDFLPPREKYQWLLDITKNIVMTTVHKKYTTQEICDKCGVPLHLLSAHTDGRRELDEIVPFEEKSKLILLSPDIPKCGSVFKEKFLDLLKTELPEYDFIVIYNMSFKDCMHLTTRAMACITFGEGFDNYFLGSNYIGTLGISVFNNEYFPDKHWLQLKNVYTSYDEMYKNVTEDLKRLFANKQEYTHLIELTRKETDKLYGYDKFKDNLIRFYKKKYDFHPSAGKAIE